MVGLAPSFLAFTFGIHIVMVNLGIGLAWLVPYFKWRGDRGEREFGDAARTLMRFYAGTYAVGGVFGTAYTVFLLSYYPRFLGLAGHLTMIPFGIAIMMIALHFFSIVAYWYGWDRWSRRVHNIIGVLLGVSALLIPFGFRAVFAFLNIPAGLVYSASEGKLYIDVWKAVADNPTYLPLYLKSVVGAITATFLVVAGAYAYKALFKVDGEERRAALNIAGALAIPSLVGLILMVPLGLWYSITLQNIPYKFNNVFASLGWKSGEGKAFFDVSWLFTLKMVLVGVQLAFLVYALPGLIRRVLGPWRARLLLIGGLTALVTIVLGEYLNAFSQYPFFIAVWPDVLTGNVPLEKLAAYGINIPSTVLPKVVGTVNGLVLLEDGGKVNSILEGIGIARLFNTRMAVNSIAMTPEVVWITIVFLTGLLIAVGYLIYIVLFPSRKK